MAPLATMARIKPDVAGEIEVLARSLHDPNQAKQAIDFPFERLLGMQLVEPPINTKGH